VIAFTNKRALLFIDGFEGIWPDGATWQGPSARIIPGGVTTVRSVLGNRQLIAQVTIPTSRGEAEFYACDPAGISLPEPGCVSAVICAADGVGVDIQAQGNQVKIIMDDTSLCLNLKTGIIKPLE
jgi:hypothetical protein